MTKRVLIASGFAVVILLSLNLIERGKAVYINKPKTQFQLPLFSNTPLSNSSINLKKNREQWQHNRLKDPETGNIPIGIRKREIAFYNSLKEKQNFKNQKEYNWSLKGPYNVGGRTRAMALDITNENIVFAGGVSGGLWRSINSGDSWEKVTAPHQHHSITCIAQDTRTGKTDTWYYGTGESYGNSASKNFSANYLGTGIFKSTDGGLTWDTLGSTVTNTPETADLWDKIWRIDIDPSVDSLDIIYAAVEKKIYRSIDGGIIWQEVLDGSGFAYGFTDISVSSNGIAYATISSNGADKGIWRSSDQGENWTKINSGTGWPDTFYRTVIGIDPSDENTVYFLSHTPGFGQLSETFFGGTEWNSLWKYEYIGGNGSGTNGIWTDLSLNLPAGDLPFNNFNAQSGYNLVVKVKPNDPNTVIIGGTNLYRSSDGFTSPNNTTQIGGYKPSTTLPFFEMYENHHPDNHEIVFLPSNNDVLVSATDGGVFKTYDCTDTNVVWESLLNGYVTSQFYTIGIDHGTKYSNVIFGGLQDNGTWWTNSSDPTTLWTMPSTGDGAFCAVEDGGGAYYFSRQNGVMLKTTLDTNGIPTAFRRIDPITPDTINGGDYQFINPFILDPADNNIMYLSEGSNLWRNDSLSSIQLTNEYDTLSTGWRRLNIPSVLNSDITALACSKSNPEHRLYYGLNNKKIYRMDDAHTANPTAVDITNNISNGGYTSCIAVNPENADNVLVVYSNYNVYSLYYSNDGGSNWMPVSGNLETGPPPGAPPFLNYIGDGPSCRSAAIIPMGDSTLYLLGTSVGLFTTDTLIDESLGMDTTLWIPQASNAIGNVVIDAIDFRSEDGFVALGTHGNGVYSTYLWDEPVGINQPDFNNDYSVINVFPNPTNGIFTLKLKNIGIDHYPIEIYNSTGKIVKSIIIEQTSSNYKKTTIDISDLTTGIYYLAMKNKGRLYSSRIVKVN